MEHLNNPEQFAKRFDAVVSRLAASEKLIAENKQKIITLEARVTVIEKGAK